MKEVPAQHHLAPSAGTCISGKGEIDSLAHDRVLWLDQARLRVIQLA
jgi:hypothetical protein